MFKRIAMGVFASLFLITLAIFTLSKYENSDSSISTTNPADPSRKPESVAKNIPPARLATVGPIEGNSGQDINQDISKIQTLKEILKSKNDNDPRLDKDFKTLSENAKRLMRNEYKALHPESFNEKGTIVFLLGQNLTAPQDFDFLAEVLLEPPCQNIEDCSKPAPKVNSEFADDETLNDVTTSYPQIVSLKNLESFLSRDDISPALKDLAMRDLKLAQTSKNPRISRMAQNIQQRLANPSIGF